MNSLFKPSDFDDPTSIDGKISFQKAAQVANERVAPLLFILRKTEEHLNREEAKRRELEKELGGK